MTVTDMLRGFVRDLPGWILWLLVVQWLIAAVTGVHYLVEAVS